MVQKFCHGGMSGVTRGQKVGFWVLFFDCHPTHLRLFQLALVTYCSSCVQQNIAPGKGLFFFFYIKSFIFFLFLHKNLCFGTY